MTTDGNMAHAHCMLDNLDYKHTLRICNTYCFSNATKVARKRQTFAHIPISFHDIKPLMQDFTAPWGFAEHR